MASSYGGSCPQSTNDGGGWDGYLPNEIIPVAFIMAAMEAMMGALNNQSVVDAMLDSWDRNNTILINLLSALPQGSLEAKAHADSPSVAEMFMHMHYVRLVLISEDAPEFARPLPEGEWAAEKNAARMEELLNESARAVRDAVKSRMEKSQEMDVHYDHPILFLQHMIWHEGYHQGQIKLALKISDRPLADKQVGPITWGIWMDKT